MEFHVTITLKGEKELADFAKRMNVVFVQKGPTPIPRPDPLPSPPPAEQEGPNPARVKCTECSTEFEQHRPTQHQCSKKCYMKAYWRNYKPGGKGGNGKQTTTEKLAALATDSISPRKRPKIDRQIG